MVSIGPLPSIGWPSALTTRPTSASPTGTDMMRPVRLTWSPSLISCDSPSSTAPTLSSSRLSASAEDAVRELEQLAGHAALEAVDAGDAVADGEHRADLGDVDVGAEALELLAKDPGDLVGANLHARPSCLFVVSWQRRAGA